MARNLLRSALVALIVLATALFAVGVIAERSDADHHRVSESAETEAAEATHDADGGEVEGDETLLGVDLESTPLLALAVVAGLGLAAVCATEVGRRQRVLVAVAVIALAWAALDAREVAHQLDESRTGIAAIAGAVALLHVAIALLAARLAARRRAELDSHGRPGTMAA